MKRMLLKISYDGTAYHGWQVQPNGITVQQTLQDSLEKILGNRVSVTGCSRTDAGVHAREFFCHIDCEDHFPDVLCRICGAFLYGWRLFLSTQAHLGGELLPPDGRGHRRLRKGAHRWTDPAL